MTLSLAPTSYTHRVIPFSMGLIPGLYFIGLDSSRDLFAGALCEFTHKTRNGEMYETDQRWNRKLPTHSHLSTFSSTAIIIC